MSSYFLFALATILVIALTVSVAYFSALFPYLWAKHTLTYQSFAYTDPKRKYPDVILTFTDKENNIWMYRGSGTFWHTYPFDKRCEVMMEKYLAEVWLKHVKHEQKKE